MDRYILFKLAFTDSARKLSLWALLARNTSARGRDGLTGISHGGDPSGSGVSFPGEEAEGLQVQTNPLSPQLPARELMDHCSPNPAALPGVWSGNGGSRNSHGCCASMETNYFQCVKLYTLISN